MLPTLLNAAYDTLKIVFVTSMLSILFGLPLGLLLEATYNKHISGNKYLWLHKLLFSMATFISNVPIFLLLIILIPVFNQMLLEHCTVELTAIISMTLINIFIFAKDIFTDLNTLPKELSTTAKFLGAEPLQILTKFLLPESIKNIINSITKLIIHILGMSIIASAFGVKGLGKLALEKSYEKIELFYIFYTVLLSIIIIYLIKLSSNYIVNFIYNNKQQS
jgi:D-methionine transport system permease protein